MAEAECLGVAFGMHVSLGNGDRGVVGVLGGWVVCPQVSVGGGHVGCWCCVGVGVVLKVLASDEVRSGVLDDIICTPGLVVAFQRVSVCR